MRRFHYTLRFHMLILLILVSCHTVQAQLEYLGFHMASSRKKKVKVNFKQYNNLIVIPVQVNGLDTLNFVLDTGVGYTLITEPNVLTELDLDCLRQVMVAGSGSGEGLNGCITNVNSIRFQGIQANSHNVIVLEEDVLHLSSYAGVKIHGLIGYDLFSRFVVKINYTSKILTFYDPNRFVNRRRRRSEVFPISIEHMKPYIQAEAYVQEENSTPVKLILDIGAGHSLSLDTGTHPNIKVPDRSVDSQIGMTLSGAVKGALGRINKFKLGSFEMEKVITAFPDSLSLRHVKGFSDRHGNLGCGVLKRFHVIFDYPHERLILKPNRNFNDPFEFNTSGIELVANGPEYNDYEVGSVRKNSPADEVGIRKGDRILAVDYLMASETSLSRLFHQINKKAGQTSQLFIRRKDRFYVIEIKLKDPTLELTKSKRARNNYP